MSSSVSITPLFLGLNLFTEIESSKDKKEYLIKKNGLSERIPKLILLKKSIFLLITDDDYYRIELWKSDDMDRKVLKYYKEY